MSDNQMLHLGVGCLMVLAFYVIGEIRIAVWQAQERERIERECDMYEKGRTRMGNVKVTTDDGWTVTLSPIAPNGHGEEGGVGVWVEDPGGQRLNMCADPEKVELSEAGAKKVLELARPVMSSR